MLTLRVYVAELYPDGQGVTPFREKMTKEQGVRVISKYIWTPRPLSKLYGLSRFFAHLAWPFALTRRGRRSSNENPAFVRKEIANIEERIKRLVTGDDYDSLLLEKNQQDNSQWLEEANGRWA